MKRTITTLAVAALASLPALPASALGSAFTCDSVTYQVVGSQLKIGEVDKSKSPPKLSYTDVGAANSSDYNAGGYNTVDNFIYAVESGAHLLKIASDGSVERSAGTITGLDASHFFAAGDVSADGASLITIDNMANSVWSVDLDTAIATDIGTMNSAPTSVDIGDFAIVQSGGSTTAYGFDTTTGALVSFDPTEDPISVQVNSDVAVGAGSAKGAVWADSSGNLTTFVNLTGDVYLIKNPGSASPSVNKVATYGLTINRNDGMKCALADSAFPPPSGSSGNSEKLAYTGASIPVVVLSSVLGILVLMAGAAVRFPRRDRS
jgi:hypothetical protein